jgi:hypothetical protein
MSKRAESAALKTYPPVYPNGKRIAKRVQSKLIDTHQPARTIFQKGYEQAEKDTIERIREQVERWMPDNPEGDEHINGERLAFRSVLVLLKDMQESMENE